MRQRDLLDPYAAGLDQPAEPGRALPLLVVAGAVTAGVVAGGGAVAGGDVPPAGASGAYEGHAGEGRPDDGGSGGDEGVAPGRASALVSATAEEMGEVFRARFEAAIRRPALWKAPVVVEEILELQVRFNEQWPEQVRAVTDIETSIARLRGGAPGGDGPTGAADGAGTGPPPAGLVASPALHVGPEPVPRDDELDDVRSWPMKLLEVLAESWNRLLDAFEEDLRAPEDPDDEDGGRRALTLVHPAPSGPEDR